MNKKAAKLLGVIIAISILIASFWIIRVQTFSIARDAVMTAFDIGINVLVQERSASGIQWQAEEFRFVDEDGFYAEYTDGDETGALVVDVTPTFPAGIEYEVVGVLEMAERGLILASGTDPFVGREFDIYRKNAETSEWQLVENN